MGARARDLSALPALIMEGVDKNAWTAWTTWTVSSHHMSERFSCVKSFKRLLTYPTLLSTHQLHQLHFFISAPPRRQLHQLHFFRALHSPPLFGVYF